MPVQTNLLHECRKPFFSINAGKTLKVYKDKEIV